MQKTYNSSDLSNRKWKELRAWHVEQYGYQCQSCYFFFDHDPSRLCVHHGYYEDGARAWEYDEQTLWWVCDSCHGAAHKGMRIAAFHIALCPPQFTEDLASDIAVMVKKYQKIAELESDTACLYRDCRTMAVKIREMKKCQRD